MFVARFPSLQNPKTLKKYFREDFRTHQLRAPKEAPKRKVWKAAKRKSPNLSNYRPECCTEMLQIFPDVVWGFITSCFLQSGDRWKFIKTLSFSRPNAQAKPYQKIHTFAQTTLYWNEVCGRGWQRSVKESAFSLNMRALRIQWMKDFFTEYEGTAYSANEGFGPLEDYRIDKSVKRSGPFSEPLGSDLFEFGRSLCMDRMPAAWVRWGGICLASA